MDNLNSKEMLKGLSLMKKGAMNLMNKTLTADVMKQLTPEQMEEVKQMKKSLKSLDKSGLNINSPIFNQFK